MKYDVIIVLAGGISDKGTLPNSVKLRIQKAKKLLEKKYASRVVFSGKWSMYREKHIPPTTEAAAMKRYAVSIGIPEAIILTEEHSNTTPANARNCLQVFLTPKKWKNVIVVTSDFHAERTKYIFSKVLGEKYLVAYIFSKTNFSFFKRCLRAVTEYITLQLYKNNPRLLLE